MATVDSAKPQDHRKESHTVFDGSNRVAKFSSVKERKTSKERGVAKA